MNIQGTALSSQNIVEILFDFVKDKEDSKGHPTNNTIADGQLDQIKDEIDNNDLQLIEGSESCSFEAKMDNGGYVKCKQNSSQN